MLRRVCTSRRGAGWYGGGGRWGYMHLGVEPDVITTAKALGGGVPIGGMVCMTPAMSSGLRSRHHIWQPSRMCGGTSRSQRVPKQRSSRECASTQCPAHRPLGEDQGQVPYRHRGDPRHGPHRRCQDLRRLFFQCAGRHTGSHRPRPAGRACWTQGGPLRAATHHLRGRDRPRGQEVRRSHRKDRCQVDIDFQILTVCYRNYDIILLGTISRICGCESRPKMSYNT